VSRQQDAPQGDSAGPGERRTLLLAKLFDLRTFIGALFLIFGAVVTVEGLLADSAAIAKASGINLSLWTGLGMLVVGIVFVVWMLLDPPRPQTEHADLSRPPGQDGH
jgi:hypothetical protein